MQFPSPYASQLGVLAGLSQQYAPLSGGVPLTGSTGFEGLPYGQSPLTMMFLQPMLQRLMNQQNMVPLGLTNRNAFDALMSRQLMQQQMQATSAAAQLDRSTWQQVGLGTASLFGVPQGADQTAHADAFAGAVSRFAPIAAMMDPGLVDAMAGRRGSAMVMQMHMLQADRHRTDLATGRLGRDPRQTLEQADRIFNQLYGGPRIDLDQTRGLSAGEYGQLYSQLSNRGLLSGPSDPRYALSKISQTSDLSDAMKSVGFAGRDGS